MQAIYSHNNQHPYNPNMFANHSTPSQQPQYTFDSQPASEDMFFALERLLMGVSPFPPTMPTLAKPTCPSLDEQLMADMATSPAIPSIVLNEQSLNLLQQYYQTQDNNLFHDHSDCSSSAPSDSPPSSPYSYASSLISSPAMPLESSADLTWNDHNASASWNCSLFEQMSLPVNMSNYISPADSYLPQQPVQSIKQTARKTKSHHRRSSSSCSAISAYESTARREHRASSISSSCSGSSPSSSRVKSYACTTCSKPFPTRTQLKSHMAIHTDSFPFPCAHAGCDLHFKRKHDLRRHVDAKHAIVKKYLCTGGCGEGFGRRDQMVRHLRRGTCGTRGSQTE